MPLYHEQSRNVLGEELILAMVCVGGLNMLAPCRSTWVHNHSCSAASYFFLLC